MLNVTKDAGLFIKQPGDHLHLGGTHTEYAEYAKNVTAGTHGWVDIPYTDDYTGHTHFRCEVDGEPRFTNAHFDKSDIAAIVKAIGQEAADIFLANHI